MFKTSYPVLDLLDGLAPFSIFSTIIGSSMLAATNINGKKIIHVSSIRTFRFLLQYLMTLYISFCDIYSDTSVELFSSRFAYNINFLQDAMCCYISIINVSVGCLVAKKVCCVINDLSDLDDALESFGKYVSNKYVSRRKKCMVFSKVYF